jgi:hypothetical protein
MTRISTFSWWVMRFWRTVRESVCSTRRLLLHSILHKLEGIQLVARHNLLPAHQSHRLHDQGCQGCQMCFLGGRIKVKHTTGTDCVDRPQGSLSGRRFFLRRQSLLRVTALLEAARPSSVGSVPHSAKHQTSARFAVMRSIILASRNVPKAKQPTAISRRSFTALNDEDPT